MKHFFIYCYQKRAVSGIGGKGNGLNTLKQFTQEVERLLKIMPLELPKRIFYVKANQTKIKLLAKNKFMR